MGLHVHQSTCKGGQRPSEWIQNTVAQALPGSGWVVSVFPAISYGVTGSLVSERGRSALEALTFLRDAFGIDWTKQESSFVRSWRWEIIETAVGQSAILPITLVAELPAKGSIRDDSIQ